MPTNLKQKFSDKVHLNRLQLINFEIDKKFNLYYCLCVLRRVCVSVCLCDYEHDRVNWCELEEIPVGGSLPLLFFFESDNSHVCLCVHVYVLSVAFRSRQNATLECVQTLKKQANL